MIFTIEARISKVASRPNGDPVILNGNDTTFTRKLFKAPSNKPQPGQGLGCGLRTAPEEAAAGRREALAQGDNAAERRGGPTASLGTRARHGQVKGGTAEPCSAHGQLRPRSPSPSGGGASDRGGVECRRRPPRAPAGRSRRASGPARPVPRCPRSRWRRCRGAGARRRAGAASASG